MPKQGKQRQIRYIDNNLIFTTDGDVYAYYEMKEYNNSFISLNKKLQVSDDMELLLGQGNSSDIHMLQIASESNISTIQNRGRDEITGSLTNYAKELVNCQTEALTNVYGERQTRFRHYMGFKLKLDSEGFKTMLLDIWADFVNYIRSVNKVVMGEYDTISKSEIKRYRMAEHTLCKRLNSHFTFEPVPPLVIAYIVDHLYGKQDVSFEDYQNYFFPEEMEHELLIRKYDYMKLSECHVTEHPAYLEIDREGEKSCMAYLAISTVIRDLEFPGNEILYHQQQSLGFPVDTSMKIKVMDNRPAIKIIGDKKKETDNLIENAIENGVRPTQDGQHQLPR